MLTPYQLQIAEMTQFATARHDGQFRKSTNIPYIVHPLKVAERMAVWGIDLERYPQLGLAGVGHDLLEDTDTTFEELRDRFGLATAELVQGMSFRNRRPDEPKHEYQAIKKVHIATYADAPIELFTLKTADRQENLNDIIRQRNQKWAIYYYDEAEGLYNGMTKRNDELVSHFSHEVCCRMWDDWSEIRSVIEDMKNGTFGRYH